MARIMFMAALTMMMASAVAQATQCSSGAECPSDDKLQSVVSLLHTKLQMSVLKRDGEASKPGPTQAESSTETLQISAGQAAAIQPEPTFAKEVGQSCGFTDAESIWARYMSAPKRGVLRFDGNSRGQGVGNVLGGLANAVLVAIASGRELAIDYSSGGVQLSDVVPANRAGPGWNKTHAKGECSATADDFNFGQNTKPEHIIEIAMDVANYQVLCYSGNFGSGKLMELLTKQNQSFAMVSMGCALNFVFDTTGFTSELAGGHFNLAGHLRLGDVHMTGGGDSSDTGRPVMSDPVWGLRDINVAGPKLVECMQGVARSLSTFYKDRTCTITVLSDSSEVKKSISSLVSQQPCNVQVTGGIPKHSSTNRFSASEARGMFTDLFTLSNADATMLTHSGFGLVAASMDLSSPHLSYQFEDFLKEYQEQQAAGDVQDTFEDFCYSKAVRGANKEPSQAVASYLEMVTQGVIQAKAH